MRLRGSTAHQLLLGGILAISALSMIAPQIYGQLLGSPPDSTGLNYQVTELNTEFDCVRQTIECPSNGGACIPKTEPIRCNDTYCNMNIGSCIQKNQITGMPSSQSSLAGTSGVSGQNNSTSNTCILTKFECKGGAESATCFKRMRHRELKCDDRACVNGACMTSTLFFMTNQLEAWDTGSLEGPFPRTETMCQIRKSNCLPGDTSCLSDVTFEQTACGDPRCTTAGSCTQTQVRVDNNDNILGQTQTVTSGKTENNPVTGGSSTNPVDVDFPVFSTEQGERTTAAGGTTPNPLEERRVLGCFRPDGTWTTVRSECDSDQSKYIDQRNVSTLMPPAPQNTSTTVFTTAQEVEVRERIEQRFYSDDERQLQLDALLNTTADAVKRLAVLRDRQEILPLDAITKVSETIEWLNRIHATFSEGTHSINEIRQQAEDVRARLAATQTLVATVLQQAGIRLERKPETLLTKMDRIFAAIPTAFSFMQEEQVSIPANALQYFLDAQEQYRLIKPECETNADSCLRLSEVIGTLEQMIALMKNAIQTAGKPELEQKINILLQQ